ncbi:MAG: hypothetical protein MR992_00270 [Lachnospiraceae bacterium]|nr:hypothetical protein [Lachnospiraceae bacterium]MDD7627818.1 hypothetical protein [Lachnospiraceae bacterium]MDY4118776.1 hypothetical protein [Lachnospiraceae bacterium]
MEITKIEPRTYTYRLVPNKDDEEYTSCLWARFIFDCDNGRLNINSDAGDYSYGWGFNEHEDFMHLMSRVDKYYLLNKLSSRSVFLLEESKKATIETITYNGFENYGIKSEEDWEEYKQDILDINVCSEETFFRTVDDIMPDIDWESIIIEKDYPHGAKVVADLFEKYLQPRIREDFPL